MVTLRACAALLHACRTCGACAWDSVVPNVNIMLVLVGGGMGRGATEGGFCPSVGLNSC
jgi:hypothetical protein